MKLVIMNDIHIRPTAPINRKDDYVEAQFRKLRQMIDYSNSLCARMLIGGDLLDKPTVPYWLLNRLITELRRHEREIYVVPGNHDLVGNNYELVNQCSLKTLSESSVIDLFELPTLAFLGNEGGKPVYVSAWPFGTAPTEPVPEDVRAILLLHFPVFESSVPFYFKDALTVEQLEAKYPGYDRIITGDIHEVAVKSKTIVTGSMMRMTIAQRDYKPRFYVLDTIENTVEPVFFDIETDVWRDVTEQVADEEYKEALTELADAMRERDERLDYPTVCRSLAADNPKYEGMIQTLINEHGGKV